MTINNKINNHLFCDPPLEVLNMHVYDEEYACI